MTSISCYAVFINGKQARVFHAGETVDHTERALQKAKEFADAAASNGYRALVEEFSKWSNGDFGKQVYKGIAK